MRAAAWGSALLVALWPTGPLAAQAKLEDNSFLIEEAYNQPTRVVQHISTAELHHGATGFSFTQEWPLGGPKWQGSYTLAGEQDHGFEVGDALLNLRWQARGGEGEALFLAPRLSVIVPVGDGDKLAGNGGFGLEGAIPLSWEAAPRLSFHANVGASWRPSGENGAGDQAATLEPFVGGSAVVFVTPKFNLLAETVWRKGETVTGDGATTGEWTQYLTLGARVGIDLPHGVQLVPGAAYMPALGDVPTRSFVYLSIEHGF